MSLPFHIPMNHFIQVTIFEAQILRPTRISSNSPIIMAPTPLPKQTSLSIDYNDYVDDVDPSKTTFFHLESWSTRGLSSNPKSFATFFTIHQPLGCPRELGSMVRISGLYPQYIYIYIYTPFISRWNHPLILTTDPNFQRDIQPSYLSDSLTSEFAGSPNLLPRGDINVTFDHQKNP